MCKIESYTSGVTLDEFLKNEMLQEAVIRNFETMGETSARISTQFKEKNHDVPWREMKDMRNFLIHDYDEIDLKLVWDAIQLDLPALKTNIEKIIN
ncbi:MAG: DUF86 domain-containing protein [Bacteroidetes bacterium]|nr:DUF86 domain-containing protein [Bacteroidota bacterium]